jgi:hypothetical protein
VSFRSPRSLASSLLHEAKLEVAGHPRLALPIARWRGHGLVVDSSTAVLIEGYPRSANSFSVAAFDYAQANHPRIAHHLHAPAHVLEAIRLDVPSIVLIRDPDEATLEFVIARSHVTARQALRSYVAFYRGLLRLRDRFVVGAFPQVTTDFGGVIRQVNERFGTSFIEFVHDDRNQQAIFDSMDSYWRGRVGSGSELERRVGRPSAERDRLKAALLPEFLAPELRKLRRETHALYAAFTS